MKIYEIYIQRFCFRNEVKSYKYIHICHEWIRPRNRYFMAIFVILVSKHRRILTHFGYTNAILYNKTYYISILLWPMSFEYKTIKYIQLCSCSFRITLINSSFQRLKPAQFRNFTKITFVILCCVVMTHEINPYR